MYDIVNFHFNLTNAKIFGLILQHTSQNVIAVLKIKKLIHHACLYVLYLKLIYAFQ